MTMPVMPGLVGESGNAEDGGGGDAVAALIDVLDSIDEAQLAELTGAGEPPAEGEAPPAGEAAPPPPAGEEGEPPPVDLDPVLTGADAAVADVESVFAQLDELLAQAEENQKLGADPKGVQKLIDLVDDAKKECNDYAADVAKAVKKEDVQAATEAGVLAQRCADKVRGLLEQARPLAAATKPGKDAEDKDAEAMRIWSERVLQGG